MLRIVQEICGFTKEHANKFRKDLVKYEKSVETEKARKARVKSASDKIVKSFLNHGMTKDEAETWWNYIEAFSRYGFNFAHSLSYSYSSYRQLFQKYFYTIEFYCSQLNNSGFDELTQVIS